jgi:hypothetical protein
MSAWLKMKRCHRSVNRELGQASREAGEEATDRIDVLCECGRDTCEATLDLAIAG